MIKFTSDARTECGLDEIIAGRPFAFVVVAGADCAALGVAIRNENGYIPIPEVLASADDFEEMEDHADALNRAEGLDAHTAAEIICSTMRAPKRA